MQLTKNFNKKEFESKDGAPMPPNILVNIRELANNLQIIRNYINNPLIINSGYRSPAHNRRVGGVSNSLHLTGKAADLRAKNMTSKHLHDVITKLIAENKISEGGVGLYNSFVHYDTRKTKSRWNYSTLYK